MFEGTLSVNILKTFSAPRKYKVHLGPEKLGRIMTTMSKICIEIICYVTSLWLGLYIFYPEKKKESKI